MRERGRKKKKKKRGDVFIHHISKETQRKVLRKEDEEKHSIHTDTHTRKPTRRRQLENLFCVPPPSPLMTVFLCFFSLSSLPAGHGLDPFSFSSLFYYYFPHINSPFQLRPTGERKKENARGAYVLHVCCRISTKLLVKRGRKLSLPRL